MVELGYTSVLNIDAERIESSSLSSRTRIFNIRRNTLTCIVAVAQKGTVYMGGDSYGSNGYTGGVVNNPKCFKTGEFLIGCTSTFRIIDLLTHKLTIPKVHDDEHSDPDKFMRTNFVDAVRRCLKENGHISITNGMESGGNFLVGYRGNVYEVQPDFSVLNVPEYGASVGQGEVAARGSLWTTSLTNMKPSARVLMALESAEVCNPGVRGPFVQLEL